MKQESHSSSSSSTSSSTPTVSEIQIREREDGINNDTSPVQVSNSVDDRSGQDDETTIDQGRPDRTEKRVVVADSGAQVLKSLSGCKNSGKFWWMMKFLNTETHTPILLMKLL